MFQVNLSKSLAGTSLRGYVNTSCTKLVSLFGEPISNLEKGSTVSTEWIFENPTTGEAIALYDYKETSLYDSGLPSVEDFRNLPDFDWHVGAASDSTSSSFIQWLTNGLKDPQEELNVEIEELLGGLKDLLATNPRETEEAASQSIEDLLTSAFEGGSNYWYMIESHNRKELGLEYLEQVPLHPKGEIKISAEDLEGIYTLNLEAVEAGLKIFKSEYPKHFTEWLEGNSDAETGDVFLQCCLFKKVVFG